MRAIWTGSISFGLVNIPVNMYSGVLPSHGLDLDMLRKSDKAPINYTRVSSKDGKEVPWEQIVKGFQISKGQYVVLTDEDFEKADRRQTSSLDIQQFVEENEIDIRFYEKPYYLEPDKDAAKAYAMLRRALEESKKMALVRFVLRQRERLGVIKPIGRALVLEQMRWPHELRDPADLRFPPDSGLTEAEIKMATQLIKSQTRHFVPEDYRDTYTEKLEAIIKEKAKGKIPKGRGELPKKTTSKDLMAALKASLEKS